MILEITREEISKTEQGGIAMLMEAVVNKASETNHK